MLEDIGDVDTKSTLLPWQNMAARVKLFNLQGRIPYAHGKKTPTPSFYAHGELSTLPLSGFPWREDSQSFPIVAGQR
jgi:hypothetical protein